MMPDACPDIIIFQRLHLYAFSLISHNKSRTALKQHKGLVGEIVPLKFAKVALGKPRSPVERGQGPFGIIHKAAVLGAAMFQYIQSFHKISFNEIGIRVDPAPIQPPFTSIIPPLMTSPSPSTPKSGLIGRMVPPQPRHSTTELSPIHGS